MSSGEGNTHWCYQCRQPIRPRGRAMVCPRCEGGFVQELEEMGGGSGVAGGGGGGTGHGSYGYSDGHVSDQLGIMDALDSLMLRSSPDHRFGLMEALDSLMTERRRYGVDSDARTNNPDHIIALLEALDAFRTHRRRRRYGLDSEHPPPPSPRLIYQGQMPQRSRGGFEMLFNVSPGGVRFTRGDNDDFFVGPGLQELMDQLMTDRRGPPPAPQSEINALPTVKITRAHIQTDSHCPVCKDPFEVGTEVRLMPCNHIYHSDCILPWLRQHNSCPVCRHVLGSTPSNRGQSPSPSPNPNPNPSTGSRSSSSSNPRGGRESGDQTPGRRTPWSFLWPFRSSSASTREFAETGGGSPTTTTTTTTTTTATTHGENHEMNYSGWPFDY